MKSTKRAKQNWTTKDQKRADRHLELLGARNRLLAHVRGSDVHLQRLARDLAAAGVLDGLAFAMQRFMAPYLKRGRWGSRVSERHEEVSIAEDWVAGMQQLSKKRLTASERRQEAAAELREMITKPRGKISSLGFIQYRKPFDQKRALKQHIAAGHSFPGIRAMADAWEADKHFDRAGQPIPTFVDREARRRRAKTSSKRKP